MILEFVLLLVSLHKTSQMPAPFNKVRAGQGWVRLGQGRIRNAKQVITGNISIPGRRELSWSDHKNKLVAINPQLRLLEVIFYSVPTSQFQSCLSPEPGLTL